MILLTVGVQVEPAPGQEMHSMRSLTGGAIDTGNGGFP